DDSPITALAAGLALRRAGFEVKVCRGGPEALDAAAAFRPDVCVLDLAMPGMDGCELARRLREQAGVRPVRCVALTAHRGEEARRRARDAGFAEHLVKPLEPDRLVDAVAAREGTPPC